MLPRNLSHMSVCRKPHPQIPEPIRRWAEANRKNRLVALAEKIDDLFEWDDFSELYSTLGQAGIPPWKLAIITILQHAEGLSDRQAAHCVDTRLDWKRLLHADLDEPAFDYSALSEFRQRLIEKNLQDLLLNKLLSLAEDMKVLKRSKQRTDATHVLANVKVLGRLEKIHESMRMALDALLTHFPQEYISFHDPNWIERYDRAPYSFKAPKEQKRRDQLATQMGQDISALLNAVDRVSNEATPLSSLPGVEVLRTIFSQQYIKDGDGHRLRTDKESLSCSERIASPHDVDARFGRKASTSWLGYMNHYTETCEPDAPRLITNVATVHAGTNDTQVLPEIHRSLKQRGLAPNEHLLDAGYSDAELMQKSEELLGITIVGPVKPGSSWQAGTENGFQQTDFYVDFENKRAICPRGIASRTWSKRPDGNSIQIVFPKNECQQCPFKADCTKSDNGRRLEIKDAAIYRYLQENRTTVDTLEFREKYRLRSGVEGTHSQAVRTSNFRTSRYSGLQKTGLQAWLVAAGLTAIRLANWITGVPLAKTRANLRTKFAKAVA